MGRNIPIFIMNNGIVIYMSKLSHCCWVRRYHEQDKLEKSLLRAYGFRGLDDGAEVAGCRRLAAAERSHLYLE